MTSILKVDTIQTAAGGTPTAADLGLNVTGSVIQVAHVLSSAQVSVSSGDVFVDLGLSITITPSSSTSKFLLLGKISSHLNVDTAGWGLGWFKDSVQQRVTKLEVYSADGSGSIRAVGGGQFYDEPATTSPITYELKPRTFSADNIEFNEDGDRGESNLTIFEIAG